jgi:hypothetical protein
MCVTCEKHYREILLHISPSCSESRAVNDITFIRVTIAHVDLFNVKSVIGKGVEQGVKL